MESKVLVDTELAVAQQGFVVRVLLKLAGRAPASDTRSPLNLSIVLDRSGSMTGGKLAAAKEAAALLVRRLSPRDVVSVVAYDTQVVDVAPPAAGDAQAGLTRRIDAIETGGSTNLSGGWLRGREFAAAGKRDGTVSRVLLLTDGLANCGITDAAALTGLCAGAKGDGVTTTTIGFGEDYDEALLRAMADAGGGGTYYIERPDQAPGVFESEIEGLLSLCAQNIAVTITPADATKVLAVRNDYPTERTAGGLCVALGDLYAREPKSLLIEFFVPGIDEMPEARIGTIAIDAHILTEKGGVEHRTVTLQVSSPLAAAGLEEPEVRKEMLLADAADARERALELRDRGDLSGASATLSSAGTLLGASAFAADRSIAGHVAELAELGRKLSRGDISAADAKYMAQRVYNERRKKAGYDEKLRRKP